MDQNVVTFDESLIKLYKEGKISAEEAINNADSKHNVQVKIRLKDDPSAASEGWQIKS